MKKLPVLYILIFPAGFFLFPMIFFEHNNQAVLSINDSIYFGSYLAKKNEIVIYFASPVVQKIKFIKGEFKSETIKGKINNSLSLNREIKRLTAEKDYWNGLYR